MFSFGERLVFQLTPDFKPTYSRHSYSKSEFVRCQPYETGSNSECFAIATHSA